MDFVQIRRRVIVAMFSDDWPLDRLVLKGGNALELIHQVLTRGSLDIDLSIAGEFTDPEAIGEIAVAALRREFAGAGYRVFDESFRVVPPDLTEDPTPWWGGYRIEFKLIEAERADGLGSNLERTRMQAQPIDVRHARTFRVDISKSEYCEGKVAAKLDEHDIFVYTEEMCVIEKFRALCQQLPAYERTNPTPRARDFYDIYATITRRAIDLSLTENLDLFRHVFGAKRVPLLLLGKLEETREFHRPDWESVRDAVQGEVFEFDLYFDFVVAEAVRLHALWKV